MDTSRGWLTWHRMTHNWNLLKWVSLWQRTFLRMLVIFSFLSSTIGKYKLDIHQSTAHLLIFHARYISDKYLNKNVESLTQFDPVKPRDSRSNQTCPCSCTNKNVKNFRGSTSEWCRGNDGEASTFNVSYEPKKCMKNIIGSLSEADSVSPRDSRPISTPHCSLLNKILGNHLLTEKLSKNKVSSLLGLVLGSRLTIPIAKPTKMKTLKISPGMSILKNNSKARPLHPKKTRRTTNTNPTPRPTTTSKTRSSSVHLLL